MKRIGKKGKINIKVNTILIDKFYKAELLNVCEIILRGCLYDYLLQFCHRHERVWYYKYGRTDEEVIELMSSNKQVIRGYQYCHNYVDNDKEFRKQTFQKLRGKEDVNVS